MEIVVGEEGRRGQERHRPKGASRLRASAVGLAAIVLPLEWKATCWKAVWSARRSGILTCTKLLSGVGEHACKIINREERPQAVLSLPLPHLELDPILIDPSNSPRHPCPLCFKFVRSGQNLALPLLQRTQLIGP